MVVSTGQRNSLSITLDGSLEAQGLARSFVELPGHFIELVLGEHGQVDALREVLPQQAVGVLVRAALPGALRIAEVDLDVGRQRKAAMVGQRLVGPARLELATYGL